MKRNRSVFQALVLVTQFGINMLVPILLAKKVYEDKEVGNAKKDQ